MSPENTLKPLVGQIITKIEGAKENQDLVLFELENGKRYQMWHDQDCCEAVSIHSVIGDIESIIGSPVLSALEIDGAPADWIPPQYCESYTFTTFKITTEKGTAEIRWLGESNGYYSESVSFAEV